MNMVRHHDKLVQQVFPLIAIPEKNLDQQARPRFNAKDGYALPRNRCNEKSTFRIHGWIVEV
jgi:hypothetical protein